MEAFGSLSRRARGVAADASAGLELGATRAELVRHLGKNGASSRAALVCWTEPRRVETAGLEVTRRISSVLDERDRSDFRRIARRIHAAE